MSLESCHLQIRLATSIKTRQVLLNIYVLRSSHVARVHYRSRSWRSSLFQQQRRARRHGRRARVSGPATHEPYGR